MALRSMLVLSTAVLALASVGTAAARPVAVRATTVKVTAKDYSFALSPKSVKAGKATFAITNAGKTTHDFAIAGHTSKMIAPGKTARLTVTLKAGSYPYRCTVDSHMKLGMKGVLRVAQ